jgi:hypothetical protein
MAEPFRDAGHLPKQRRDGRPAPPDRLPRQRRGTTPQRHGRYPDYDVLEQAPHWDEVTREVVLDRVRESRELRFFDEAQARTLGALFDVVLAQDADPRIPVLHMIDAKLADNRLDGFRYDDMPDDRETYRQVAAGLDEAAGGSFDEGDDQARLALVQRFSEGALTGRIWDTLPCARAWSVIMRGALSEFYSHPWAWNEIGYGGPRYPRGYVRLAAGQREPDVAPEAFDLDPVADVRQRGLE